MNRRALTKFLKKELEGMTLEDQKKVLEKISNRWLPEFVAKKYQKYTLCPECGNYSVTKKNSKDVSKDKSLFTCPDCTNEIELPKQLVKRRK